MILLLAALLAALPALPPHAPPAAAKAERKLLESRAKELKKKKEWPLAAGTAVVVRAEGKKGEPALVIVRGKAIHATVSCAVVEQGPEAGAENAVAERVWSFTGGAAGVKAMERFQLAAQLRDGKVEAGARGDGDNFHSAVFLEPQSDDARLVLGACEVKGGGD